jgi:hypothetical protein
MGGAHRGVRPARAGRAREAERRCASDRRASAAPPPRSTRPRTTRSPQRSAQNRSRRRRSPASAHSGEPPPHLRASPCGTVAAGSSSPCPPPGSTISTMRSPWARSTYSRRSRSLGPASARGETAAGSSSTPPKADGVAGATWQRAATQPKADGITSASGPRAKSLRRSAVERIYSRWRGFNRCQMLILED